MTLWLDAQLSPDLAPWLEHKYKIKVFPLKILGLRDAEDEEIYQKAKVADVIIMTKDSDFIHLQSRLHPPPRIIWITCGNTSNDHLKALLDKTFITAMTLLGSGEKRVEITGKNAP